MSKMFRAALTGPSGSGKSTISELLREKGITVIDCDAVVRKIEEPGEKCYRELVQAFGAVILYENGEINRRALAAAGFENEKSKKLLNSITHKYVLDYLDRETERLEKQGEESCVIEAGALLESGLNKKVDSVFLVYAPESLLVQRITQRDSITEEQALQRLHAQVDLEALKAVADAVYENSGNITELNAIADDMAARLKKGKGDKNMGEKAKQLWKELGAKDRSAFCDFAKTEKQNTKEYCDKYMSFLNKAKTEREYVNEAKAYLTTEGFTEYVPGRSYKPGDRIFWNNKNKSMIAAVIGRAELAEGINITAAHIDSPRLDLKPRPLYEDSGLAYFKTHYYGGIKKYQWAAIPLSLHGKVILRDGREIELCLGEDDDHVFYISDLLPHLSGKAQGDRKMREVLTGEELNILLGSEPFDEEDVKDPVKLNVLKYLNDKYGMVEDDFLSAEIEIVPAFKAKYVGFDDTLIASYGHDDRVCAYTAMTALAALGVPEITAVCVMADKEEIGSCGNTGMNSDMLRNFVAMLCKGTDTLPEQVFMASNCLSADVNAAYDPNFPQVYERLNTAFLNCGPTISKYTGSGGKGGSNDASAEYMGEVRRVLDAAGIPWQVGELGKVDEGGGGTVAVYISKLGIDTVDIGVALLSMHSPFEIASSYDVYATFRAIKAFFENMK